MPPQKTSVQCIPVTPIKDQVKQKAFDIRLQAEDISQETWNRYPCILNTPKKCQNDHCNGKVSFLITPDVIKDLKILTLLFVRENENAYVYFNRQLRSLFESGILEPVVFETININQPVIPEPDQNRRGFPGLSR